MKSIKRFSKNPFGGKDYIVGDIHGCFTRLSEELNRIGFDETKDRLFCVGDLVDRGKDSELAYEWLSYSWFHTVYGNHEQMAIDYFEGWLPATAYAADGGRWFVNLSKGHQQLFVDAFRELPIAFELETDAGLVGIVHADCPLLDWNDFKIALTEHNGDSYAQSAIWDRYRIENFNNLPDGSNQSAKRKVLNIHALVVGHSFVPEATQVDNVIYIDTGAVFGGQFTILNAATLKPV